MPVAPSTPSPILYQQELGNYRDAHKILFETHQELTAQRIRVPQVAFALVVVVGKPRRGILVLAVNVVGVGAVVAVGRGGDGGDFDPTRRSWLAR